MPSLPWLVCVFGPARPRRWAAWRQTESSPAESHTSDTRCSRRRSRCFSPRQSVCARVLRGSLSPSSRARRRPEEKRQKLRKSQIANRPASYGLPLFSPPRHPVLPSPKRSVAMASKVLFNRVALRRAASTPVRSSHTLTVPYTHNPITPFANGVPTEQVRELNATEKNWDFWTTSDAFRGYGSSIAGLTHVPPGEVWVLSNGKAVKEGMSFLLPFVSKVQAVKNSDPVAMGVLSDGVVSKDGHAVNVYSVFHIQVTDFSKSALYVDPESNKLDSERAAAKLVVRTLEAEIPKLTVGADRQISAADSANLAEKIVAALKARSEEFGLEVLGAEIRGAFDPSEKVSDKLRALSPSLLSEDSPIDGLKADYWAELLSPPFFEKRTFGSEKIARTPATVSLEWCIPSPPDYHHFNQVPRMVALKEDEPKKVAKGH